ncbi:hypothetical protein LTS18_004438 [Coniosporium uncinatum]|uniref:Uncharacterized protein n=1 Tax=Coniosporium uncinatum TaxID=93489 RepID=A0ACC3D5X2_9PEZI|nr:hypothetical protein LTS18_004438 [Coniosporium uncinatum]
MGPMGSLPPQDQTLQPTPETTPQRGLKPGMSPATSMRSHSTATATDMSEVEPLDEPTPSQGEQSVESGGGEKRSRRWRGFSGSSPRPKTASLHIGANEPARRSLLSVNSVEGEAVESAPRKSIGDLDTIASASLVAAQSGTNTNTTATSTTNTATAADSARDREREREQQEKKSAGGPLDWFKQKIHEREERRAEKQAEKEMKRAKSPEGWVGKNNRGASMLSLSSSPPPAPSNAMTMEGREKEGRERRERRERSMDVSRKDDQGTIKRRGDEGGLKEGREEREDITPTGLPPAQQQQQQQGVGQQQSQAQMVGVQSSTQTQNTGAGSWRSSSPVPPKASLPIP